MNFDVQNDDFYKRLDLDENATSEQVKKNFFQAVRIYPPEQHPEEHKLIRDAYDVLINNHSRNEYNARKKYGKEIKDLEERLDNLDSELNQDEVEQIIKKLVILAPNVSIYRNRMGLVYLRSEKYSSAKKQFEKAVTINPENIIYLVNLAEAEKKLKNYDYAEKFLVQAWDLDKEDYEAPRALAQLYYDTDRKVKTYGVLEKAIMADGVIDFQDFFCIFDKLHYLLFDKKNEQLEEELKRIQEISRNQEEKNFSTFMLMKTALALAKIGEFAIAVKFAKVAYKLDNDESTKEIYDTLDDYIIFDNDNEIMEDVKKFFSFYFLRYFDGFPEDDFQKFKKIVDENIHFFTTTKPQSKLIRDSFEKVRLRYPNIFKINYDYNTSLLNAHDIQYKAPCPYCGKDVIVEISDEFLEHAYKVGLLDRSNSFNPYPRSYECPHCNKEVIFDGNQYKTTGLCYITTATCYALGKGDNCRELETFRRFRDRWLIKQEGGAEIIDEYYRIAPKILNNIYKLRNPKKIFIHIWKRYLNNCYRFIVNKQYDKAKRVYIEMVTRLYKKYYT